MVLTPIAKRSLCDCAINVGAQLRASKHQGHRDLSDIILGLCAVIARREPELFDAIAPAAGEPTSVQAEDDHPLLQMGEDLRPTTIKRKR